LTTRTDGFIVVAYSSPYGEFSYFYYTGTPGENGDGSGDGQDDFDKDILNPVAVDSASAKWLTHTDGSYTASGNNAKLLTGDATVSFSPSSGTGASQDVIINDSGGVTLPNL
jgi:hypothetical protein